MLKCTCDMCGQSFGNKQVIVTRTGHKDCFDKTFTAKEYIDLTTTIRILQKRLENIKKGGK